MEYLELDRIGPALECLGDERHRRNVEVVNVLDRNTLEMRVGSEERGRRWLAEPGHVLRQYLLY